MKNSTYKNVVGIIGVLVQASADLNQNVTHKQEQKEFCEAVFIICWLAHTTSQICY